MKRDRKTVLQLLKEELAFLDSGGYQRCLPSPWRAAYIFEESPSCPNFVHQGRPYLCQDCWLMEFVPQKRRTAELPCRFVKLTIDGATVDSLYRYGTPSAPVEALRSFLCRRINTIEKELGEARQVRCQTS